MIISASIVIYNESMETLKKVIESFSLIGMNKELIIVDNSESLKMKEFVESFENIKYIHSDSNIGFGAGHNLAFKSLSEKSDFHLILNPDVYFKSEDVMNFLLWMNENKNISLAVPQVYFPDNTLQRTIRNIPTPMTLIKRRLNIGGIFDTFIKHDEMQHVNFTDVSEIPFAHGCFFVFKTEVFKQLNGFDERFFMYMEDVDIFIRAKLFGKTVINPEYKVYHEYRKESSKKFMLLLWHISSAIKFFIKYNKLNLK